jgi:hypothetical protein
MIDGVIDFVMEEETMRKSLFLPPWGSEYLQKN